MHTLLLLTLLAAIDPAAARRTHDELQALCRADAGKLWGISLCGPLVFADPQTREAIRFDGSAVETLTVPPAVGIANTSAEWDGKRWTMLMWPVGENAYERRSTLAHESWHRVQERLGFPPTGPSNAHLDGAVGRYWLRLEWRALARALETGSRAAVEDALLFRARRRALIAGAAGDERALEMHEGLAEYTGTALAEPSLAKRAPRLVRALRHAESGDRFVRNFAYASGPAWGALLEMRDRSWTRRVKATDDLGDLAQRAWNLTPKADAESRALVYGGAALRAAEDEREARKQTERAALRARYVDGPTLTLPLRSPKLTFDPNGLQPLDDRGTVYRSMTVSDEWGRIEVTGGALVSSDWQRLVVPASGDGYTLTLNEGWVRDGGTVRRRD